VPPASLPLSRVFIAEEWIGALPEAEDEELDMLDLANEQVAIETASPNCKYCTLRNYATDTLRAC
jgi:hypothetical protein